MKAFAAEQMMAARATESLDLAIMMDSDSIYY